MSKKRKLMLEQFFNLIAFAFGIAATCEYGYFFAEYRDKYSKGMHHFLLAGTIVFGVLSLLIAMYMMLVQIFYERCKDE